MNKKRVYHSIEWVVALAACGYLIYRLAVYEDYASLWAALCNMLWKQFGALCVCVALMPVNMGLEAWRWKTLIPMSWNEAHRQVYYSKLAGLITPWRLGEYPARALLRNEWAQTLSMGAVGSATMTLAIVVTGAIAMIMANGEWLMDDRHYWVLVGGASILLGLALLFAPRLLRRWAEVSHKLVVISVGQSVVRLACWCVQLALALFALSAFSFQLSAFSLLPIYYLLVTITPNVPIAEVGVRGAWAIIVFGSVNAALAGVLLWGINTLLPCLIGAFLLKNTK